MATHPLKRYRDARSLTQRELAAMIGTSDVTVARLETGTRQPSFDLMRRISEATGGEVSPNDFLLSADAEQAGAA
jgi:transcriptional regulator with XRE-family HTH domain